MDGMVHSTVATGFKVRAVYDFIAGIVVGLLNGSIVDGLVDEDVDVKTLHSNEDVVVIAVVVIVVVGLNADFVIDTCFLWI